MTEVLLKVGWITIVVVGLNVGGGCTIQREEAPTSAVEAPKKRVGIHELVKTVRVQSAEPLSLEDPANRDPFGLEGVAGRESMDAAIRGDIDQAVATFNEAALRGEGSETWEVVETANGRVVVPVSVKSSASVWTPAQALLDVEFDAKFEGSCDDAFAHLASASDRIIDTTGLMGFRFSGPQYRQGEVGMRCKLEGSSSVRNHLATVLAQMKESSGVSFEYWAMMDFTSPECRENRHNREFCGSVRLVVDALDGFD